MPDPEERPTRGVSWAVALALVGLGSLAALGVIAVVDAVFDRMGEAAGLPDEPPR